MVGHSFVLFLWLSIPDTICYVCLLFFIQASDYLILLLDPYILLDIWEMSDSHLVWYFDIALVWLSNRSIFMVFCILLWAKSDGLDSMRHLHRLRKTRMRAMPHQRCTSGCSCRCPLLYFIVLKMTEPIYEYQEASVSNIIFIICLLLLQRRSIL